MLIYGLDFTSAPRKGKPITCAVCERNENLLLVRTVEYLTDFAQFEALLKRPGPWIGGFDFPFGLPYDFINTWWVQNSAWVNYVEYVGRIRKDQFLMLIKRFRDARPPGRKHPLRRTDERAGSISPLMVHGVPVGRMFYQGAPRLLAAGVNVVPCHVNGDNRVALETYPALTARHWIGKAPYKHESRRKQTRAHVEARRAILDGLLHDAPDVYGFALELPDALADDAIDDPTGDTLDALLCAVQAAWGAVQPHYGVPPDHQFAPDEGWIVAPELLD